MSVRRLNPTINLIDWIEGECYKGHCKNCVWPFPFAKSSVKFPECPIEIVCIECETSAFYCPKEFEQVRAS